MTIDSTGFTCLPNLENTVSNNNGAKGHVGEPRRNLIAPGIKVTWLMNCTPGPSEEGTLMQPSRFFLISLIFSVECLTATPVLVRFDERGICYDLISKGLALFGKNKFELLSSNILNAEEFAPFVGKRVYAIIVYKEPPIWRKGLRRVDFYSYSVRPDSRGTLYAAKVHEASIDANDKVALEGQISRMNRLYGPGTNASEIPFVPPHSSQVMPRWWVKTIDLPQLSSDFERVTVVSEDGSESIYYRARLEEIIRGTLQEVETAPSEGLRLKFFEKEKRDVNVTFPVQSEILIR
jgi:hypothetical protein